MDFNTEDIIGTFLIISLMSVLSLTIGIILLGTGNDYALGTLYDIEVDLVNNGIITDSRVISQTEDINQSVLAWFGYLDNIWLLAYVAMSIMLFMGAYYSKRLNFFTFCNLMYVGIFLILFILDSLYITTVWVRNEVLLNILPTANTLIPKFTFFLDHLGIIISIQLALCFLLNVLDLNIVIEKFRKNKEQEALKTEEVL